MTHVTNWSQGQQVGLLLDWLEAMSNERLFAPVSFAKHPQIDFLLPKGTLKRKIGSLLPSVGKGGFGYPSPPMSSPPTPSGPPPQLSLGALSEPTTTAPVTSVPPVSFVPNQPAQATMTTFAPPPPPPRLGYLPYPPPFPTQPIGPSSIPAPPSGVFQGDRSLTSGPTVTAGAGVSGPSSIRTGRKSKAHVASACINCKRAHLSCDVQRPCTRCVASGKQVSS